MRVKGSGEKLKKKISEKQKETGKAETGEEKCGERLGDGLEKEDGLTFEEKSSRGERDEGEWYDEESSEQSQDAAGPFIRLGNRRFRRTAEVREKLAKVKATAIERVLEELEVDAEKKQMVMEREELVERVSRVYGEELRRADVADPNKARYIRDKMVTGVEESLEEKGGCWKVAGVDRRHRNLAACVRS